jgi:hypothetical protein
MCLDTVATKEELEKWKANKGKYVKVYKSCNYRSISGYWCSGIYWTYQFKAGWNKDHKKRKIEGKYQTGFHCHLTRKAAESWGGLIVTAYVPTAKIVAIGKQDGYVTLVSRHIYMPKYPERVAEKPK